MDKHVEDGAKQQPDRPNFGESPAPLLSAGNEGDWDIPALTFPSIDDADASQAQTGALSFPKVDGTGAVPPAGTVPAASVIPVQAAGSAPAPRSASSGEPVNEPGRVVEAWAADHPTFSSPLAQSAVRESPVPAPQATATSETTVLPPVGAGSSRAAADEAFAQQETTVIAPNALGAVADTPQEGSGLRGIIEGTSDRIEPPSDGGEGTAEAAAEPPISPRKKLLIGVGAIAVIAAVAGVTAFGYFQRTGRESQLNAAVAACKSAADDATKANDALAAELEKAKTAQKIPADQLADSSLLAKLTNAVSSVESADATHACTATLPVAQLNANAKQNAQLASTIASDTKTLTSAVKAVTDSQAKKTKADTDAAKKTLEQAVADAKTLLANSEGAVADDATRQTLQAAVDKADALLKASDPKLADLTQAQTDLQNASTAVNDSMNAYTQSSTTQNNTGTYQYYGNGNTYQNYGNTGTGNNGSQTGGNTGGGNTNGNGQTGNGGQTNNGGNAGNGGQSGGDNGNTGNGGQTGNGGNGNNGGTDSGNTSGGNSTQDEVE